MNVENPISGQIDNFECSSPEAMASMLEKLATQIRDSKEFPKGGTRVFVFSKYVEMLSVKSRDPMLPEEKECWVHQCVNDWLNDIIPHFTPLFRDSPAISFRQLEITLRDAMAKHARKLMT